MSLINQNWSDTTSGEKSNGPLSKFKKKSFLILVFPDLHAFMVLSFWTHQQFTLFAKTLQVSRVSASHKFWVDLGFNPHLLTSNLIDFGDIQIE